MNKVEVKEIASGYAAFAAYRQEAKAVLWTEFKNKDLGRRR